MAETIVENQICNACGVDVREGSLFCYNCGGAVASEIEVEKEDKKDKASDVWLRENLVENGKNDQITNQSEEFITLEKVADKPIPKPEIQTEANLKSAAAMRRKSATFQKKQVEVVWEENDAPNASFIVVALILSLFAVAVFFLAIYLK